MARGWESKLVEEQISQREGDSQKSAQQKLTSRQIELRSQRESILLARSRILSSLESACHSRYRALLERSLSHLNTQLARLETEEPTS
ncbi:MAG: hypothetical protein DMG16_15255 [Acidobacteria bacterium]|nr:MAG: hypothetical protein DMG16_15255 [Acidobacteriota bacterium]